LNLFTVGLVYHLATVQRLLPKYGLSANVNVADCTLTVRGRNRYYRFYPQFICDDDGRPRYSPEIDAKVRSFVGWRPYFNKRWPIAIDKRAFKDFCVQHGLRTPQMWLAPAPDMRDFLVKHSALSFGKGMHGPFRSYARDNPAAQAAEAGYYEQFVVGRIAKAWYWEDRLACVDIKEPPAVTGDGKRSMRALIASIARPNTPKSEWSAYAEVLAWHGLTFESVPREGERVMIDYRFGTYAEPLQFENQNALARLEGTAIGAQLRGFGPVLCAGIPEELRPATVYAIDAIVDAEDRVWLLEVNCNPVCHPDTYEAMFETLFGAPEASAPPPVPPASALPPYQSMPRLAPALPPGVPRVAEPRPPETPRVAEPRPPAVPPQRRWLS
jgi:hypothetical protein